MVMSSNVIFVGWNRPVPGREKLGADLFQDFMEYVTGLQEDGTIQSLQPVLLNPHGGDMNGFFLITGEPGKLDALASSEAWETHMTRAGINLEGVGVVRGVTGDLLMQSMARWTSLIPE
jgi:hypothetical protein